MAVGGILFILGLVPAMPQMLILPAAAIALGAGWQMRRMAALAVPAEEPAVPAADPHHIARSEEHTSELQSLMRISYAVFCLKKTKNQNTHENSQHTHISKKQHTK